MQFAWEVNHRECMQFPTFETYAEERSNLGVEVQGGVGWYQYIPVYGRIYKYTCCIVTTLVFSLLTAGNDVKCMGHKCMHAETSDRYAEVSKI